jgi:hypothetical protein
MKDTDTKPTLDVDEISHNSNWLKRPDSDDEKASADSSD